MAVKPLQVAAPVVAPNMKPAFDQLTGDFQQAFSAAQNFGRMNPQIVQEALAQGGSLSNTFGFRSASEVAGLSPQELMALTNGQSVNGQLQQAQQTFDSVTGGAESRQAQRLLADRLFQGGTQMLTTGANQQVAVDSANRNVEQSANNAQFQADFQAEEHQANRTFQAGEGEKDRKLRKYISDQHTALEKTRQRYLENAAKAGSVGASGTTPDEGMMAQLDRTLIGFGAIDKKTGELQISKVPAGSERAAISTYFQREASKGLPYNTPYNVPENMRPHLSMMIGGKATTFSQLRLGKAGWHGVYEKNGQRYATDNPVVPFISAPRKGSSQEANSWTAAPVYQQ